MPFQLWEKLMPVSCRGDRRRTWHETRAIVGLYREYNTTVVFYRGYIWCISHIWSPVLLKKGDIWKISCIFVDHRLNYREKGTEINRAVARISFFYPVIQFCPAGFTVKKACFHHLTFGDFQNMSNFSIILSFTFACFSCYPCILEYFWWSLPNFLRIP